MINMGNKIKDLRIAKNMSQTELGDAVHVSKNSISGYEIGSRYPTHETLIKIAAYFHVTTDYLLGLEKERAIDVSDLNGEQIQAVQTLVDTLRRSNKKK